MESMRSWLYRLGKENGIPDTKQLLQLILPEHLLKSGMCSYPDGLCVETPPWVYQALEEHSGLSVNVLQPLTLAYWVPPISKGTDFKTYIKGCAAIERPSPSLCNPYVNKYPGKEPVLPWLPTHRWTEGSSCRFCREADNFEQLTWTFGLIATCPWHEWDPIRRVRGRLTADWYTSMALRHGEVLLPSGAKVSATWWLRFLRSLIHEISFTEWWILKDNSYADPFRTIWQGRRGAPAIFYGKHAPITFEDMEYAERRQYFRAASLALDMIIEGMIPLPKESKVQAWFTQDNLRSRRPASVLRDFGNNPEDPYW